MITTESFEGWEREIDTEEIIKYRKLIKQLKESAEVFARVYQRLADFADKNPDARNYNLWHDLIGSTIDPGMPFDSDDRIVRNLIDDLAKEFLND